MIKKLQLLIIEKFQMNNIQQMAIFKALDQARIQRGAGIMDLVEKQAGGDLEKMGLKRVQFETHPSVFELLENTCSLLDVSKREFLECAMLDAIANAERIFGETFKDATGLEFGQNQDEEV